MSRLPTSIKAVSLKCFAAEDCTLRADVGPPRHSRGTWSLDPRALHCCVGPPTTCSDAEQRSHRQPSLCSRRKFRRPQAWRIPLRPGRQRTARSRTPCSWTSSRRSCPRCLGPCSTQRCSPAPAWQELRVLELGRRYQVHTLRIAHNTHNGKRMHHPAKHEP